MIALFASLPSIITDQSLLGFISFATMILAAMIQPLAASLWPSPIWSLVASVWPSKIRAAIFWPIAGISRRDLLIVGYVTPNLSLLGLFRWRPERSASQQAPWCPSVTIPVEQEAARDTIQAQNNFARKTGRQGGVVRRSPELSRQRLTVLSRGETCGSGKQP